MNDKKKNKDRSDWAIGGGVIMGTGLGFFFFKHDPMAFVGLMVTAILSTKNYNSRNAE